MKVLTISEAIEILKNGGKIIDYPDKLCYYVEDKNGKKPGKITAEQMEEIIMGNTLIHSTINKPDGSSVGTWSLKHART